MNQSLNDQEKHRLKQLFQRALLRWSVGALVVLSTLTISVFSLTSHAHAAHAAVTQGAIHNKSIAAPSLVGDCNGSGPVVAFIGTDKQVNVDYLQGQQFRTGLYSSYAPAITCYNNTLWLAFDDSANGELALGKAPTASVPTFTYTLYAQKTDADLALTSCNGELYLGWEGTDTAHHLNMIEGASSSLIRKVTFTATTAAGVGLTLACLNNDAAYSNKNMLYVAWTASSGTPYLEAGAYTPGSGSTQLLSANQFLGESSDHHPTLVSNAASALIIAYKGNGNTHLNISTYGYTTGVGTWLEFSATTSYAPAMDLGSTSSSTPVVYTGTDNEIYFYYESSLVMIN